jgi:hypothetical protein
LDKSFVDSHLFARVVATLLAIIWQTGTFDRSTFSRTPSLIPCQPPRPNFSPNPLIPFRKFYDPFLQIIIPPWRTMKSGIESALSKTIRETENGFRNAARMLRFSPNLAYKSFAETILRLSRFAGRSWRETLTVND